MRDSDREKRPLLDRRQALALGVGAFVVASVPLAMRGRRRLVRRRVPLMGTIGDVAVVHDDRRAAHAAITAAFDALHRTEALMSHFKRDSDVGLANRRASKQPVPVSGETAHVVAEALRWAEATDGRFDPCLGRAVGLWDVKNAKTPPAGERVRALAGRGLWQALELDDNAVRLRDADAAIDLGGIAKGHGVDAAVAALRAHGIEDALVNVGGDLYAMGRSEDGDAWSVGVVDPRSPGQIGRTLEATDVAVATSGDYQQFFEYRGKRYHHLLDPWTAAPSTAVAHSVTVTAATCLAADAAATAAFGVETSVATPWLTEVAPEARIVS